MAKNVMRVGVDLSLDAVGKFLADMQSREGVLNIHLNLPDEKYKPDPVLPRSAGGDKRSSAFGEAIVQAIAQNGPSTKKEVQALMLPGFPNKPAKYYSGALHYLGTTGRLVCGNDLKWSLTKKYRKHLANGGAKTLPPPGSNGHAAGRKKPVTRGKPGRDLLLENMKAGKPTTKTEMVAWFEADGRSGRSVGDQLSKLIKARKVKRVGVATYELTAAGAK